MNYTDNIQRIDAKLMQEDVFDVLRSGRFPHHKFNIIIMQYIISHFFNTEQVQRISELFDSIISNVLPLRDKRSPFLIIIRDVDSMYKGRNKLTLLIDKLEEKRYCGNAYASSYYSNGDLGEERWSNNKMSSYFGNINYHFTKNDSEHDGAQLFIELE
jgi:hypothetical protein